MILTAGVLIALVGLILVGSGGGGSVRRRRNFRLPLGLFLMIVGALVAIGGSQFALTMGWLQP